MPQRHKSTKVVKTADYILVNLCDLNALVVNILF